MRRKEKKKVKSFAWGRKEGKKVWEEAGSNFTTPEGKKCSFGIQKKGEKGSIVYRKGKKRRGGGCVSTHLSQQREVWITTSTTLSKGKRRY